MYLESRNIVLKVIPQFKSLKCYFIETMMTPMAKDKTRQKFYEGLVNVD